MTRYVAEGVATPRARCSSSPSAARPARSCASASAPSSSRPSGCSATTRAPPIARNDLPTGRCSRLTTPSERRLGHRRRHRRAGRLRRRHDRDHPPVLPAGAATRLGVAGDTDSRRPPGRGPRRPDQGDRRRPLPRARSRSTSSGRLQPRRRRSPSPARSVGDPQAAARAAPTRTGSDHRPAAGSRFARGRARRDRPAQAPARRPLATTTCSASSPTRSPTTTPRPAQRMRQRWKIVLVDEFQDTDPVQWQVLDRAFSGARHDGADRRPQAGDLRLPRRRRRRPTSRPPRPPTTQQTLGGQLAQRPAAARLRSRRCSRGAALGDERIVVRRRRAPTTARAGWSGAGVAPFRLRVVRRERARRAATRPLTVGAGARRTSPSDLALDVKAPARRRGATFEGRAARGRATSR